MAAIVKRKSNTMKKNAVSKSTKIVKGATKAGAKLAYSSSKISAARSQAKKIMQGLHEAEQIRAGKLKATTFEDHFGKI